jgi:radical SAM protein with 4Fe4S-binding SPASM domain
MPAKFQTRLSPSRRTDLGAAAPLDAPFVLIVDPASHCNFKCRFCPTGDLELIKATGRYQGSMAFATFEKIIDDLAEFAEPIKVLRLYKEGEPLMNKRFADMVRRAKASARIGRVDTTTNGVLLSPETSEKIIEAGIDQINVSVNGVTNEQFHDLVRTKVDFARYVERIRYLYSIRGSCVLYVKAIKENLSEDDQKRFLDIFGEIADRVFFEHLIPNWPGFEDEGGPAEYLVGQYGDAPLERAVCPYIFYQMIVNSDGSVSLCVQDWARKLLVGSVLTENVRDIWLGRGINVHRLAHLDGRRKENATCRDCQVMSLGVHDNLDAQAEEVKRRMAWKS